MQTTETHPQLCALLLAHPMAYVALQRCVAYAAATESCDDGACECGGADRQLCGSNASSRIWVTLTPLSYCQIISPSCVI